MGSLTYGRLKRKRNNSWSYGAELEDGGVVGEGGRRLFCDIPVSLWACVYCALGRLSAAALAASRSRRIREAAAAAKNGADLFASGSAIVSSSARIRRQSHKSCVSRGSERELDQIKGNLGTGLPPIPSREGKNDGI